MNSELLAQYFTDHFGEPAQFITPVSAQGSNRTIARIQGSRHSVIGVLSEDQAENAVFCYLARHFRHYQLRVPEIFVEDPRCGLVLLEDLGTHTLFDLVQQQHSVSPQFPPRLVSLYAEAVRALPRFQIVAGTQVDFDKCIPPRDFDTSAMILDMKLFEEQYLRRSTIKYDAIALSEDFHQLSHFLAQAEASFFLYRDFQSRNIVVANGSEELGFIDFQGGKRGPLQYDLVSLLHQSRAQLPEEVRTTLLDIYLDEVQALRPLDVHEFREFYYGFVLMRLLQVLGRYAKLAFVDRKRFFEESIPFAVTNLTEVLRKLSLPCHIPTLQRVLGEIPQFPHLNPSLGEEYGPT